MRTGVMCPQTILPVTDKDTINRKTAECWKQLETLRSRRMPNYTHGRLAGRNRVPVAGRVSTS